jgi:hypothetical protein
MEPISFATEIGFAFLQRSWPKYLLCISLKFKKEGTEGFNDSNVSLSGVGVPSEEPMTSDTPTLQYFPTSKTNEVSICLNSDSS